jgi:hypothetical protein
MAHRSPLKMGWPFASQVIVDARCSSLRQIAATVASASASAFARYWALLNM